jgi:DNA adenine methylase
MPYASLLPKKVQKVLIPPIKSQGIKTKLIRFILSNISWDGGGRWIEPFLGSGVVLFNVQPQQAIVNDINPHIIRLYQMIYTGDLTPDVAAGGAHAPPSLFL